MLKGHFVGAGMTNTVWQELREAPWFSKCSRVQPIANLQPAETLEMLGSSRRVARTKEREITWRTQAAPPLPFWVLYQLKQQTLNVAEVKGSTPSISVVPFVLSFNKSQHSLPVAHFTENNDQILFS